MENLRVAQARQPAAIGKRVRLQGWIRNAREYKNLVFLDLNDGSSLGNIQVVTPQEFPGYESTIRRLSIGCSVVVEGEVVASQGKQPTEVRPERIDVLGWADPEKYQIQQGGRVSLEKLREWAHLRPRTNTFGAVTRVRNRVSYSIHQFFQEEGFLYIHTPIITASDCEGAGKMFQVTTLDLNKPPRAASGKIDHALDFFGKPTYLTVSGQLEGEIFACSMGKIYTFGPTFRAENSNTTRHLAEFWMVEPEAAFFELTDNMDLAERFLKRLFADVLRDCAEDMAFFRERYDKTIVDTLEKIVASDFVRIPYTEAITILEKSGQSFEFPVSWGVDLSSEHERYLTEKHFHKPVILYDYPADIKAFYMYRNDDGRTVRAMDVLAPGVGEIIGGSQREHRLDVLETQMRAKGLDPNHYSWYLDLRRFGSAPHSGFGLGLERVVQFITGMGNIRDVIPFPRTPGSADF